MELTAALAAVTARPSRNVRREIMSFLPLCRAIPLAWLCNLRYPLYTRFSWKLKRKEHGLGQGAIYRASTPGLGTGLSLVTEGVGLSETHVPKAGHGAPASGCSYRGFAIPLLSPELPGRPATSLRLTQYYLAYAWRYRIVSSSCKRDRAPRSLADPFFQEGV